MTTGGEATACRSASLARLGLACPACAQAAHATGRRRLPSGRRFAGLAIALCRSRPSRGGTGVRPESRWCAAVLGVARATARAGFAGATRFTTAITAPGRGRGRAASAAEVRQKAACRRISRAAIKAGGG